ncbi:vps11 [Candida theae]|uniref:Vps11 n=1 Tax=Candida theae TaxID=1198502 RepID=A0AAD5BF29_9ASCO|nr:vps11 [Candida theae]KAI5958666.1 vps11 [Candida theae]
MHYMTSFLLMSAHTYLNATYSFDGLNHSIETATDMDNELDTNYLNNLGVGPHGNKGEEYQSDVTYTELFDRVGSIVEVYSSKESFWPTAGTYSTSESTFTRKRHSIGKRSNKIRQRKSGKVFGGIKMNAKNVLAIWQNRIRSKKLVNKGMKCNEVDRAKSDLQWDGGIVNNAKANLTSDVEMTDLEWTEETDELEEDFDYSSDEREPLNLTSPFVLPVRTDYKSSPPATPVVITQVLTITKLVTLPEDTLESVISPGNSIVLASESTTNSSFPAHIDFDSKLESPSPPSPPVNDVPEIDAEYDKVFSVIASRKVLSGSQVTKTTALTNSRDSEAGTVNSAEELTLSDFDNVAIETISTLTTPVTTSEIPTQNTRQEVDPAQLVEYDDGHLVLGRKSSRVKDTVSIILATTTPSHSTTGLFSILPIKGTTIVLRPTSLPHFRSEVINPKRMNNTKISDPGTPFTSNATLLNKSQTSDIPKSHPAISLGSIDATNNASTTDLSFGNADTRSPVAARGGYSFTGVILPRKPFVLNSVSSVTESTLYLPSFFQLFDFIPIRDPNYQSHDALYSDPTLSAINATKAYLVIAVNNSILKIINPKDMTCEGQFQAYDIDYRITFIEPVINSSNLIMTLAEKQGFPSIIKVWDLTRILNMEKLEASEYKFKFQTQVSVTENSRSNGVQSENSFPISCFKFNFDLTCLAIGYANGKVILVRGDLLRDRGSKQRVIYESFGNDPITGIQFNEEEQILYVTTTSKVLTVSTTGRNHGKPLRILSQKAGADLDCTESGRKQELIVGRPDSIRYYNPTTKLKTINFDVPKSKIARLHQFILMVSSTDNEYSQKFQSRIIILDTRNNHISLNLLIPQSVIKFVFKMGNEIYLLSNDGVLYRLYEKPINQQIELVLQRELFSVAFNLAKQSKLSSDVLLRIQTLHADHLFDEQKYDEAMDVYISCLGLFKNEAADAVNSISNEDRDDFIMNVITKFKEAINTANMVKFLERLYAMTLASVDHITLLLCCLCKLKNLDQIDSFIDELDLSNAKLQELNFPLIINLFKECGFYNQVLRLLYKLNQPNLIVEIQLNDLSKPKLALSYMKTLKIDDLLLILIDQSKKLLDSCPIETTELLINVFTGKYQPTESTQEPSTTTAPDANIEEDEKGGEGITQLTNYKAFLNYLTLRGNDSENEKTEKTTTTTLSSNVAREPTYLPPKPNLIYSSFTNHPNEFVIFLEACIEALDRYQGNLTDKKEVLITLLEMYLSLDKKTGESEWLDKADSIVDQYGDLLDDDSLLLLSHLYRFKPGEIKAREDNGDEEGIFMSYKIDEDVEGCFKVLQKYGQAKPQLYKMMLEFIVSKREVYEKVNHDDIQVILQQIKKYKLLDPLELISLLNGGDSNDNEFVTFGIVKDYLLQYFTAQEQEITNNEKLIEVYEHDSTKNSYKLSQLTHPFVIQNNKCSACQMKLDFPVIHFKCKHSFHQKCLSSSLVAKPTSSNGSSQFVDDASDHGPKCPICAQALSDVNEVKQSQYTLTENVDFFVQSLRDSTDTFKFISEYIGKGVMEDESVSMDQ